MKKLITLLAVLTLALAMAVPAFAASGTASSTGTITIDNAVTGTTYKAYRIFDLESYDTNKDVYSYKLNTKWNDFSTFGDGCGRRYDCGRRQQKHGKAGV